MMTSARYLLCLLLPLALAAEVPADIEKKMETVVSEHNLGDQFRQLRDMTRESNTDIRTACLQACGQMMDEPKCPRACNLFDMAMEKVMESPRKKRQITNDIVGIIDNVLNIFQSFGIFDF